MSDQTPAPDTYSLSQSDNALGAVTLFKHSNKSSFVSELAIPSNVRKEFAAVPACLPYV